MLHRGFIGIFTVGLLTLSAVCGCGGGALTGMVRRKAANDLECPAEQVHVHRVATSKYRAIGCERWADYRCGRVNPGSVYCYRPKEPVLPPPGPSDFAHAEKMGSKSDQ
jgi:hypothetical protein